MENVRISVLIPTLNEEESIGETLDQVPRSPDMEIAIIDGLSKDRTREIAVSKGARVIEETRRGYGRAYKTGFKEAKGDIIVTLDGDTTYPAEMIQELVSALESGNLDFISCDRIKKAEKGAFTLTHAFGNWLLKAVTNVLFGTRLSDSQTGMWVFRKEVLRELTLTSDGMPLSEEIKIEVFTNDRIRSMEISVPYRMRAGEKKLSTFKDGWRNLSFLFKKRLSPSSLGEGEDYSGV
ncbi:MAG: glycosyltransferase family 2 protein [Candidatus Thermoplasmatota archaeon]|nr:glycosyltransferase family 2 protein [Candidatus Thermoplasmatota archaeon]